MYTQGREPNLFLKNIVRIETQETRIKKKKYQLVCDLAQIRAHMGSQKRFQYMED